MEISRKAKTELGFWIKAYLVCGVMMIIAMWQIVAPVLAIFLGVFLCLSGFLGCARGYVIGRDERIIRNYIKNQEAHRTGNQEEDTSGQSRGRIHLSFRSFSPFNG